MLSTIKTLNLGRAFGHQDRNRSGVNKAKTKIKKYFQKDIDKRKFMW